MSVALVCVAHGDKYREFIPRWMRAVHALNVTPDEVIIVTDSVSALVETLGKASIGDATLKQATGTFHTHPQVLVNEGISATSSEWVCKMDADDLIFPHALDNLDTCDADVYMFGIQLAGRWLPAQQATRFDVKRSPHNLVFSGSPFKRWVWERAPYRDMICEDWVFWIEAARNGARFQASPSIDYEYCLHGDNITSRVDTAQAEQYVRETFL